MEPQTSTGAAEQATAGSAAKTQQLKPSAASSNSFNVNSDAPRTTVNGTESLSQSTAHADGSDQMQNTSLTSLPPTASSPQSQSISSHDALLPTSEAARLATLAVGVEAAAPPKTTSNAPSAAAYLPSFSSITGPPEGEGQQHVSATADPDVLYARGSVDAVKRLLGPVSNEGALATGRGAVGGRGKARKPLAPKGKGRATDMDTSEDGHQTVFAPIASTSGATFEASGVGGSEDVVENEIDEQTRIRLLFSLDQKADEVLAANSRYAHEVVAVMNKLDAAKNRSEELQSLVKDMHTELADGTDTVIIAPGTMQVTLPWHKHFHGQDLPSNPDSAARELYLETIRYTPWTPLERGKLKKEVIAQNNRHIAIEAHRLGQSISDRLAQTDPAFFEQSTEFLDWGKISQAIPRRSASDCRIQWLQQDYPLLKHGKWKKDELERLYEIVERKGERNWKGISEEMGVDGEGNRRTPAECLRQFRRRTGVKKEWTDEEDERLRQGVKQYGEEWQVVALLVGRPSDQCINRWNKAVKPTIRRGQWKPEEDEAVHAAVAAVGLNWLQIARRVEGRTDAQCRERWVNKLDPKIKAKEKWSEEEDKDLRRMRDDEKKSWVEISNAFDGRRTDNQCMRRYNTLNGANRRAPRAESQTPAPKTSSRKRKRKASPSPSPAASSPAPEAGDNPPAMDLDDEDVDEFVSPRSAQPARRKPAPRAKRAREEDAAPKQMGRPKKVKTSAQVEPIEVPVRMPVEVRGEPIAAGEAEEPVVEEAQAGPEETGQRKSGRQRKGKSDGGNFVSAW